MTLEQGARCHPSLWARLAHPESRRTHWENTGLDQDLMVQEPIELNEIEEKFWKDRWAVRRRFKSTIERSKIIPDINVVLYCCAVDNPRI